MTGLGQLDGVVFSALILGLTVLSLIEHPAGEDVPPRSRIDLDAGTA